MFPPQGDSSDFEYPRGPLKRFHEDEAAAECINGATIGFTEHRNKRLHTLPLRTSPTARKWALPMASTPEAGPQQHSQPAMTPPGSFSEDSAQLRIRQQEQQEQQEQSIFGQQRNIPAVVESVDMDMDMAPDDTHSPAHPTLSEQGHLLEPGAPQPDQDSVVASRMPTPIQPSFAVQVRGNSWGGGAGNLIHNSVPPVGSSQSTMEESDMEPGYSDRSVPRSLEHPANLGDWSMVQNRALPSPISESGGEDTGSPDMVLDSMALHGHGHNHDHDHEQQQQHLGHSPAHLHADAHEALCTPIRPSGVTSSSPAAGMSSPLRAAMDGDPAATPSPKKGHSRSRHTLVAWTQQPGMKKSFSIGYRADCEKCRNRVPGHFNHIIVS